MPDVSIRTTVRLVACTWDRRASQGLLRRQSLDKLITVSERFLRFAEALDVVVMRDVDEHLLQAFIDAPGRDRRGRITDIPEESTRRSRRWTLSAFCAEARRLGLTTLAPILDTPAIPGTPVARRSELTVDDIQTLCFHAERGMPHTRHASVLALLLAGFGTGEIGPASTADLDLEHRRVWAGGTRQLAPRFCPMDDWSCAVLELRAAHVHRRSGTQGPLPLNIQSCASDYTTQSSIGTTFAEISRRSGALSGGHRAKPGDITAYVAAQTLAETGQITQVAIRLGLASLDVAAQRAGLRWDLNRDQNRDQP